MDAVFILGLASEFLTTRNAICGLAPASSEVRSAELAHRGAIKIIRASHPVIGSLIATLVATRR